MPILVLGAVVALILGPLIGWRTSRETSARTVAALAIASGGAGWALLAFAVVGPSYLETTTSLGGATSTRTRTMLDVGLAPMALAAILLEVAGFLAVVVGGLLLRRGRRAAGTWVMSVGIVPLVAIGSISFGLAIAVPATVLAIFTVAIAWTTRAREA